MSDIKNTKNIVGSHRENEDLTGSYNFVSLIKDGPGAILTKFDTVAKFIKNSASVDYVEALPKDFLERIFKRCKEKRDFDLDSLNDEDREYYRCEYSNKIVKFNRALYYMIMPYVSIVSSSGGNIEDIAQLKKERYTIIADGIIERTEPPIGKIDIEYKDFPTIDEYITKNKLDTKALEDLDYIINELDDISRLSQFVPGEENSFMRFTYRVIRKMGGNITFRYPRSVINYSAFEFSAEGYPYHTMSDRIYSVTNVPKTISNKFLLRDIYNKNVTAILTFLSDLSFNDHLCGKKLDNVSFETKVLCNAFGIAIALIALHSEKKLTDNYLNNSLMSRRPFNEM